MKKNIFRGENLNDLMKYNTVKKNCIVCGSNNFISWAKHDSFKTVQCRKCGFIWMRPFLTDKGLTEYYSNYIGKRRINNKKKMEQRAKQYIQDVAFLEHYIAKGKLLDVGCNGGFLLNAFNPRFKKYGLEIDAEAVKYAKKHFKKIGNNIHCLPLEKAPFKKSFFDVIVMRGTIEHVPNPIATIKKTSQLLKKGGYYYITATPNGECFAAKIYRDKWGLYHPVQHIWYFSPKTLSIICKKFGLKLIAKEFPYLGTPYENAYNDIKEIANTIQHKQQKKNNKIKISPPFFESMMSLIFQKQ